MHGLGLETDEQGQPPAAPRSTNQILEVNVDTDVFLSHQSHCLAGRATLVFPAQGVTQDGCSLQIPMVCKIYHPEVQRRHEGQTPLQVFHQIATDMDEKMAKHLPSMLFYGDVPGCTTQRIRSMVKQGHHTLRILGLKKLDKITNLEGADFIRAWLETLICHSFLWKNYVERGDPSLSNIMYDPDEGCGVLSDFDLSLLQWEPGVVGTDRPGTVPFMAIGLLDKGYWEGTIPRFYHHEMESFIWILAYVVLYDKGARKAIPEVDAWRTSDYVICQEKKLRFYTATTLKNVRKAVQPSYQVYWPLVEELCSELYVAHANHNSLLRRKLSSTDLTSKASEAIWKLFTDALQSKYELLIKDLPDLPYLLGRLQLHKPSFSIPRTYSNIDDMYSP